jgi:PAS domain S-box-containing protein
MQTVLKRFSVIGGFVVLLAVLAGNTVIMRRQLAIQAGNQDWVSHTYQVLLELSETESLLRGAEAGQRGYLYTGNPKYLTPFNLAVAQAGARIDNLARLTIDNPRQQARISVLRSLTQSKLSEYARIISLHQAGRTEEAKALALSDDELLGMKEIWQQIRAMEQDENSLISIRSAAYRRSIRVTVACLYVASVLAALGAVLLAFYILREMDLRERHAHQMREREEWFRVTLTSLGDAVIATDEKGLITFLNPVAEQLTGWTLALAKGKRIDEVFPIFNEHTHRPIDNPVKKVIELGIVVGLANHTVLRHADGTLRPIEDSAAPIRDDQGNLVGVVLVFRDASRERESQEMLRKTEKLAAAARLAATFAHEINNPLEAVVNLIYIVKGIEGIPTAALESLDFAEQELERISHIARQTLGFYRESTVPGLVDLSAVIENVLKLYSNKLKTKHISVERDFREYPPTHGLAGELTQAISNLISNAADAVALGGTILVSLSAVETPEGSWAKLTVEDDGPGVPKEQRSRIFEPFFTTKTDVGNGLGLWVTREIIQRHRGHVEVGSKADSGARGAVFTILLPSTPKN